MHRQVIFGTNNSRDRPAARQHRDDGCLLTRHVHDNSKSEETLSLH